MDHRLGLMKAAVRLFAQHGYDAVGVQQIVEAAEVTKPTLYHYFGSKQGLITAILEEKGQVLVDTVANAAEYHGDLSVTLTAIVKAYFGYASQHQPFYRMLLTMWFAPNSSDYFPAVRRLQRQQFDLIEAMFKAAVEQHGNMAGRHAQYAVSFRGMIDTYIGLAMQEMLSLDDERLVNRVIHQFMHGLLS